MLTEKSNQQKSVISQQKVIQFALSIRKLYNSLLSFFQVTWEQLLNNISNLNLVEADPKNNQKWTAMLSENENNRSLEQIAKCITVIKQEAKII